MPAKPLLPILLLLVTAVLIMPWLSTLALGQTPQLRMVVLVTRHGVRSPLDHGTTGPYQKEPWPSLDRWHVTCPGDLTPRGSALVEQMGSFYHAYYAEKKLLSAECPASKVYIWADNEERTLGTARALAAGMAGEIAGCRIPVESLPYTAAPQSGPDKCKVSPGNHTDYFFHPLSYDLFKAEHGPIDTDKLKDVAKKINEEVPKLLTTYRLALEMLNTTLCGGPTAPVCNSVLKLPTEAKVNGTSLKWAGMFAESSTDTENFLLEYGNGMPCNLDGWGLVTYKKPDCSGVGGLSFREMQDLHTVYFDRTHHDGYMGQIQGSNLANQILLRLGSGSQGKAGIKPFVIYSGHDTDVASVAGLLKLDWTLPDLPRNDTPPAGALIFELWGGTTLETQTVRVYYAHQTVEQMRTLAKLSVTNPPDMVELPLRGCEQPCPFTKFRTIAKAGILMGLTTTEPWGNVENGKAKARM